MNNTIMLNITRFIVLILVQILILNNINFLGYINPYSYVLFVLLFPLNPNKGLFLFASFLLGLTMDMFGDSGGVHAAACLSIAFVRPVILRWVFGVSYEFQTLKLNNVALGERLLYSVLMVTLHHSLLFLLETFNFSLFLIIIKKILFSSIFTSILCMMILILFRRKE